MKVLRTLALLLPIALWPHAGHAQSTYAAGIISGASQYDLSGTGTQWFSGLRIEVVPSSLRNLVIEGGVHHLSYRTQSDDQRRHWFPEVSAQLQLTDRVVRPYIGVGAGYSFTSGDSAPTLSASLGSRIEVCPGWLMRLELRVRSVDPWAGTTADWGIGVSREL